MISQMRLMLHPSFLCRHARSRSLATGFFSLRIDWNNCFLPTLGMNLDPESSVFSFDFSGRLFSFGGCFSVIAVMQNIVKFRDLFVLVENVEFGRCRL